MKNGSNLHRLLKTYFRNSNIQEIEKIQKQLVVQLKSKKVDPQVLTDVDEFARIGLRDRTDDDIAKRTQSNYGLEAEPRMLLFQQSKYIHTLGFHCSG